MSTLLLERAEHIQLPVETSAVVESRDLPYDSLLQKRAQSLIGGVALQNCLHVEQTRPNELIQKPVVTLSDAIERASKGDQESLDMVRMNVTTDYLERAFKSGFISEVYLQKTETGRVTQFGQSLEDVHINSLRFMPEGKLRDRSKIELLNGTRDHYYADSGTLRDKVRIIASLVHEDMDDSEAVEAGFFVPTRSLAFQLLTEQEDGQLLMQTAFVAGRENPSDEPFDKEAVIVFAQALGIDFMGASTEEILSRPILADKNLFPNLICDVAERYDRAVQIVTGKHTFFGLEVDKTKNTADYNEKYHESLKITQETKQNTEQVVERLIARKPHNPVEATLLLSELNDALLKRRIISDRKIDSRVLGAQAAYYVEHARHLVIAEQHSQNGVLLAQLDILQRRINHVGQSSSCPSAIKKEVNDLFQIIGDDSQELETKNSELEDCDFISKQCPKCGEKNVRTECRNGKYYGACGCKSD